MLGSLWFNSFSSGGGAAAYELISTTVLGSSAASVTFSSLNTGVYKHLQIRAAVPSGAGANGTYILTRLNGDSESNYSRHELWGQGSSVLSNSSTSATSWQMSASSGTNNSLYADGYVADFLDPFSTSKNKTMRNLTGVANASGGAIALVSGAWYSTAAVTSIALLAYSQGSASTFGAGSRFSIYGLR